MSDSRDFLTTSLQRRTPTWDVANAILKLDPVGLPDKTKDKLKQLVSDSPLRWYSGEYENIFNDDFDRPVPATKQIGAYIALFPDIEEAFDVDPLNPDTLHRLVATALRNMGFPSRGEGHAAEGLLQARAWRTSAERKRLRFLRRFEQKIDRLRDTLRLRHAQMQAKSRLAYLVDGTKLDDLALSYVAYVASRANLRSQFILGPQVRMKDEIVEEMEHALFEGDVRRVGWEQIALVRPIPSVMNKLDREQLGFLIGTYHAAMTDAAAALRDLYHDLPTRMRAEMVMVKGIDSSRWNAYAGALNSMRSAWLNASLAIGLDTRGEYLPGKAPRLMASDLVWWYRNTGRDLHEDTTLFAALPKPWEVVLGGAELNQMLIEKKADELGVDVSTGWTGPRKGEAPEKTEPEPTLVHGIAIADPRLAQTLRRCGVFSGKSHKFVDELPEELVRIETFDGKRITQPVLGATQKETVRDERT